jgi:hypothetical protein
VEIKVPPMVRVNKEKILRKLLKPKGGAHGK